MVQQVFYLHHAHLGGYPMRQKEYPALPLNIRLQRWLQRTYERSTFMRLTSPTTTLHLKESLASALGLPDAKVTISRNGELRHSSRSEPLAYYIDQS